MSRTILSSVEPFWEPCDLCGLLQFFAARALPGVEAVDPENLRYQRTIDLATLVGGGDRAEAAPAVLRVEFGTSCAVEVSVADESARETLASHDREAVSARVRRMFDFETYPPDVASPLSRTSEFVAEGYGLIALRMPGAWDRFELGARAVLGQQVSVAGARTLAGRLVSALGSDLPADLIVDGLEKTFPNPARVAAFDPREIGLPASRASALRDFAAAVASGELRLDADPADVRQRLLAIKGIGPWTVEYIAMRALGDRDAFPASDLGLRKAIDRAQPPSAAELEVMAEAWRPVRAYAAILLWRRAGGG